jgi:hypothetical protein
MDVAALERRLEELRARHGRGARRAVVVLAILIGLMVAIRMVLDPLATHATRKAIAGMKGFDGEFQRVHVTIFSPGYTITRVKLIEVPGGSWRQPLFYAERVHVGLDMRELLHGRLLAGLRVEQPKVIVVQRPTPPTPKKKAPPAAPDLSTQLSKITPLRVGRIEVVGAEILFRDAAAKGEPELWVHRLDAAVENLATRPKLAGGRPTTVSAHGTLGRSGGLTLFVSADPFAQPLAFAGRCELRGLDARELYDFIAPEMKMQVTKGEIDLFAEFTSRAGEITGAVKPVLKNIDVKAVEPGFWNRVKADLADSAVKLASDRVPGRNAMATTVPIKGNISKPDVQLWPAVFGVIRNAFIEGLASGFANLPPATANKKESKVTQAKHALEKDQGPPKAQPK